MLRINWPWAKSKDNYWVLAGFIILCQSAGLLGTIFTFSAIPSWYAYLIKPAFSPPNWIFGPVWTLLYTMMGLSAYLVWRKYKFGKKAIAFWQVFFTQLILNTLWTPLFFGLKWVDLAFFEIVILWYFVYQTIKIGHEKTAWSGYLLIPYIAWITFASLLNLGIAVLN